MSSMYKNKRDSRKMGEINRSMAKAYDEILRMGESERGVRKWAKTVVRLF